MRRVKIDDYRGSLTFRNRKNRMDEHAELFEKNKVISAQLWSVFLEFLEINKDKIKEIHEDAASILRQGYPTYHPFKQELLLQFPGQLQDSEDIIMKAKNVWLNFFSQVQNVKYVGYVFLDNKD